MPLHAADPRLGTWKLISSSRAASSQQAPSQQAEPMATYEASGADGVRFSRGSEHYTAQFDDKEYPASGRDFDMVSLRRVDPRTVAETRYRNGKQVGVGLYVVSPDGRRMTVTLDGVGAGGRQFHSEEVWEKR